MHGSLRIGWPTSLLVRTADRQDDVAQVVAKLRRVDAMDDGDDDATGQPLHTFEHAYLPAHTSPLVLACCWAMRQRAANAYARSGWAIALLLPVVQRAYVCVGLYVQAWMGSGDGSLWAVGD